MKVEYINPFLVATITTFNTMLNCALTRGTPYVRDDQQPQHEVSGVIGLSGKVQGTVVLGLGRRAALKATEVMRQERCPEINGDVVDAIGELANIIAGQAKAQLEHLELSVSLPSVITGRGHRIQFPTKVTPICIPFQSDWGTITVEVGLCDLPTAPADAANSSGSCAENPCCADDNSRSLATISRAGRQGTA
jgi:chemotaxis protein CheX